MNTTPETKELDVTQPKPKAELTALPPKAGGAIKPLVPQSMEELKYVAGLIIDGGLAPDSYEKNPRKIALGIMKGLEVGLAPITALQWIAIINGRPTVWGDGAIALVESKGVLKGIEEKEIGPRPDPSAPVQDFPDDYGIEVCLKRKGQDGEYIGRFTVADAKRAHLWAHPKKQPWMLYPKRMLRMRAMGFALRNGFADCLSGMMIREEVEDIPAAAPQADTSFLDEGTEIEGAFNAWTIPDSLTFEDEFRRQLAEVVDTPDDIDALISANFERVTDDLKVEADERRQEISETDEA